MDYKFAPAQACDYAVYFFIFVSQINTDKIL